MSSGGVQFADKEERHEFYPDKDEQAGGGRERRESNASNSGFETEDEEFWAAQAQGKWWQCGPCAINPELEARKEEEKRVKAILKEEEQRKQRQAESQTDVRKTFDFKISDIVASFEQKLDNAFLEIIVGGKTAEKRSAEAVERVVTKKKADKDGNQVEVQVTVREYRKKTQLVTLPADRFYTRKRTGIKTRTPVSFAMHEFRGNWVGSYDDLEEETITLCFWNQSSSGPNVLIGLAHEKLIDIANDKVDREVVVQNTNEGGRKTITAIVQYKFVFQELFQFKMDFVDWEAQLEDQGLGEESDDELEFIYAANSKSAKEVELQVEDVRKRRREALQLARKNPRIHRLHFELTNARNTFFSKLGRMFFACQWTNMLEGSLGMINGVTERGKANIQYSGTRAWLENEELILTLYRLTGPLNVWSTKIATKSVTLQGVLDHGYILAHMDYEPGWGPGGRISAELLAKRQAKQRAKLQAIEDRKNRKKNRRNKKKNKKTENVEAGKQGPCGGCFSCLACLPCCSADANADTAKDVDSDDSGSDEEEEHRLQIKGVVNAVSQPLYRQLGNVGRASGPSKWFQLSRGEVYLVVKIVRAKGLTSLDEFKEQLNPSVMVEWGGVRKVTRVISGNNEPFWDDDLYFKIPDVVKFPPDLIDDFGPVARESSLVLSIWDHEGITKSPLGHAEVDFDSLYQYRTEKRIENTRQKGKFTKQWVYETKRPLVIPSIRVEEDDHREAVHTNGDGHGGGDDDDDDEEQAVSKNLQQYIEFYCYFDQGEEGRKIDRPKITDTIKTGKPSDSSNPFMVRENDLFDPTPMTAEMQNRAKSYWDESLKTVPAYNNRFFAFMGKDQYSGMLHYLPTFVKPMHPPTEIQTLDRLFYFIHCIEYHNNPEVDQEDLPPNSLIRNMPHTWVWCDPFFFLEKKRGDIKDHALLLCNFLLGLNLDAWLCIGTARARSAGSKRCAQEHIWVMTRHNFTADNEDGNSSASNKEYSRKDAWKGEPYVLFWEISNNRIFPLKGKYLCQADPKPRKAFVAKGDSVPFLAVEDIDAKLDMIDEAITNLEVKRDDLDPVDHFYNDVGDEQRQSRMHVTREGKGEKRDILTPLRLNDIEVKRSHEPETPYLTLDVVFNHQKMYGNLQAPNPEVIKYDLKNMNRWRKFHKKIWSEFLHTSKITPFYNDKSMNSMPLQEAEAAVIQDEILERVKGTIRAHREYEFHVETQFYDEFPFPSGAKPAKDIIFKRLALEEAVIKCEILHGLESDMSHQDDEAGTTAGTLSPAQLDREREKWRNKILNSLDGKSRYTEKILLFKHTDGSRISDSVVEQCSSAIANNILSLKTSQDPVYAVGVKVERLPSMVSPVRVYIGVTFLPGKQH